MYLVKWFSDGQSVCRLCNDFQEVKDCLISLSHPFLDMLVVERVIVENYEER